MGTTLSKPSDLAIGTLSLCERPVAQKPPVACLINSLSDHDLSNIFKHLPLFERLLVSEVCSRWYGISRAPWCDIAEIDLGPIPGKHITAIVKQCPNLQTVSASGKTFSLNELNVFTRTSLSALKFYKCWNEIREPDAKETFDLFAEVFSSTLPNASWEELTLCYFNARVCRDYFDEDPSGNLPCSLKRLQLSGVDLWSSDNAVFIPGVPSFLNNIGRLQNLTCLILSSSFGGPCICLVGWALAEDYLFREVKKLVNLVELCIGWDHTFHGSVIADICSLPKLEVLFLNNVSIDSSDAFVLLATKHPTLRILVITGQFDKAVTIPTRRLYPNGFAGNPLPLLHIFVGRRVSEKITFTKSSTDALRIHPITDPLPEFLEKAEVAPIFEGSWIAAQMKEGDKRRFDLWSYGGDDATSFRQAEVEG